MKTAQTDTRPAVATEIPRGAVRRNPARRRPGTPRVDGGSREARVRAAVILDVLAGVFTPADAAKALTISLPRYYALESRLLTALVESCEARPRGRTRSVDQEIALLTRELERLKQECARKQSLVRAVQRTIGVTLPERRPLAHGRRRRRPVVRALKAAAALRAEAPASPPVDATGS